MSDRQEREQRFDRRMSDAEALMWNVEKDPWLNPNGGTVNLLDRPLDFDELCARLRYAVVKVPRLRERVVAGVGRLAPPVWATDPEFDFDYHVRRVSLPGAGTRRQLFDLACRLYEDPFDRTRPLWQFVAIDGLEGGKGALFWKLHHSISDGIGAVRLSELYMTGRRDTPPPPEVDLDQVIADAIAAEEAEKRDAEVSLGSLAKTAGHVWRRQLGIGRRAIGEVAIAAVDPSRARELAESAVDTVRGGLDQIRGGAEVEGGSPLWASRSRGRHLESFRVPLDAAKAAGKTLGGSINDVFMTGIVEGAVAYHAKRSVTVDAFNTSFVVSTRTDKAMGGNSFTPAKVQISGAPMPVEERLVHARDRMAARRETVSGRGGMSQVAGIANLLPTSVVTGVARSQAAKMDFATSNLRAAPFQLYIAGAAVESNVTMGPVAGTAFNITTVSYNGYLDVGMLIDPAAVEDPADLRNCIVTAFEQLMAAGGAPAECED